VLREWDLPTARPGAEWQRDTKFNAAEEISANPDLKDVYAEAIEKGAAVTVQKT
jgi:hypothetical protein